MATVPVEIISADQEPSFLLMQAIEEANRIQTEFAFSFIEETCAQAMWLHVRQDTHTNTFFGALERKKSEWKGYHPFIISFLSTPIHSKKWGGLFSSRRAEKGLAIVTTAGVEDAGIPADRMQCYFLHELAVHALAFIVGGKQHHHEPRGCAFDFHEDKTKIVESMKSGDLCDECRGWFLDNGQTLSDAQLSAIVSLLQRCSQLFQGPADPAIPTKHRVFVASSSEGLEVARAIQSELQSDCYVEIWDQSPLFGLGTCTIEALEAVVDAYDCGIFVFTADDTVKRRGAEERVARDNVVFEAGLFIGKLGRFRSFLVRPNDVPVQLPSDLKDVTFASYDSGSPNLRAAVGPACSQIRASLSKVDHIGRHR